MARGPGAGDVGESRLDFHRAADAGATSARSQPESRDEAVSDLDMGGHSTVPDAGDRLLNGLPPKETAMPLELLPALADDELPLELFLTAEVRDKLRILHDAGHIICSFPPAEEAHLKPIRVHMVTPLGHRALRYFGRAEWRGSHDGAPDSRSSALE